jgi:hypothetical protein
MKSAFIDYFRCPESFVTFALRDLPHEASGYFQFGPQAICYGRSSKASAQHVTDSLRDTLEDVSVEGRTVWLPFDPSEIAANLRFERYVSSNGHRKALDPNSVVKGLYYAVRPFLSVCVRKHLQRRQLRNWREIRFPQWPVDASVDSMFERLMLLLLKAHGVKSVPFIWFWPEGFPACAVMTHDVEAEPGRQLCPRLMDVDDSFGIKSSFEIVPEGRYAVSNAFREEIRGRNFEINIHDLDHDGRLFSDRQLFLDRAEQINRYGIDFGARGFRSAILYRNVDWFDALDFAYDMSVPSVGSLEAQRGGCCSVTPYFIGDLLEIPVTTTQDYSLFHILNQYSIDLWKRQIRLISGRHGVASFIIHPDYIFEGRALGTYQSLLTHLAHLRSEKKIWIALPGEVNQWWRERSRMRLVNHGAGWEIEGPGKERARVAYASVDDDGIVCDIRPSRSSAATEAVNAA